MPLCMIDSILSVLRIHTGKYAKQSAVLEINETVSPRRIVKQLSKLLQH